MQRAVFPYFSYCLRLEANREFGVKGTEGVAQNLDWGRLSWGALKGGGQLERLWAGLCSGSSVGLPGIPVFWRWGSWNGFYCVLSKVFCILLIEAIQVPSVLTCSCIPAWKESFHPPLFLCNSKPMLKTNFKMRDKVSIWTDAIILKFYSYYVVSPILLQMFA